MTSDVRGSGTPGLCPCQRPLDALAHGLRQQSFRLGQPEGHVHGAVQLERRGQRGAGVGAPFQPDTEFPKASVAVRRERAHAKLLGQGEGLLLVGLGLVALRRLTPCGNLAERTQGIHLMATFLASTGERQRTCGVGVRLLRMASQ
jgi:hypothetical protein